MRYKKEDSREQTMEVMVKVIGVVMVLALIYGAINWLYSVVCQVGLLEAKLQGIVGFA